jgi:ubiquinone/menaquinone biosynthesis C-methylase UbiE
VSSAADADVPSDTARDQVDLDIAESIRVQAEEHPLIDDLAPQTPQEKCLQLIHLKAYDEGRRIAEGCDVLDVGCNTGYGTVRLVGAARSITGVDVSPAAIEAARTRAGAESIEFRVVDGKGLPFPDASFDLVTSFQVFEHVVDTDSYLSEIKRVLRPGGRALFTTPNAAIRLDPGMTPWNRFHVREYLAEELRDALTPVFPEVTVRGMFAVPTLYDIETERADSQRKGVRRQLVLAAERAAEEKRKVEAALLPPALPKPPAPKSPRPGALKRARNKFGRSRIGGAARALIGRDMTVAPPKPAPKPAPAPKPVPAPKPTPPQLISDVDVDAYTIDDLFYGEHDLLRALDLMVLCRVEGDAGPSL